jgi:Mg-chelatase subunit ChlD
MTEELSNVKKLGVKRVGIQGVRAQAREAMREIKPEDCAFRFAIGFDDSGSMGTQPLADAKKAVAGFLGACTPTETSVAVVPFSGVDNIGYGVKAQPLTCMYDLINAYLGPVRATSGTPLYGTMKKILTDFNITRGILFSDGGSTDKTVDYEEEIEEPAVQLAIEKKIPFDTVYIGGGSSPELKHIADVTGGVYLEFTDTSIFARQMKYLSPRYVALLANAELKAKVERGENI